MCFQKLKTCLFFWRSEFVVDQFESVDSKVMLAFNAVYEETNCKDIAWASAALSSFSVH